MLQCVYAWQDEIEAFVKVNDPLNYDCVSRLTVCLQKQPPELFCKKR